MRMRFGESKMALKMIIHLQLLSVESLTDIR
jgi:hypothetical protein